MLEEFENDADALDVIDKNFRVDKGFVIHPRVVGYEANKEECKALCYLQNEWDFAAEGC